MTSPSPSMQSAARDYRILPFTLDAGLASRASIGLIVLATDHTIEHEWRHLLAGEGIALYESRLHNAATIDTESLAAMESRIAEATALILPEERLDVMAFGCTSGAMVIGEQQVFARIREARPGIACTTPITAAVAALKALQAPRIALLTPYIEPINRLFSDYLASRGVEVAVIGTFNHGDDNEVARIDAHSLRRAIIELGTADVDAVFVSCTSLRVATLIPELEQRLGKPVISSNHAMAWHALRLAGVDEPWPWRGHLFATALARETSS